MYLADHTLVCSGIPHICTSVSNLGDIDIGLIERCCTLGSHWSQNSGGRCPSYPASDLVDIRSEDRESCLSLVNICCGQSSRSQQCDVGRDVARSEGTCHSIDAVRANLEVYTHRKVWCKQVHITLTYTTHHATYHTMLTHTTRAPLLEELMESFNMG